MSMKFADGTSTNKYDQETQTATLSRVDNLHKMIITGEEQIRQRFDKLDNDLKLHIESNGRDFDKVSEDVNYAMNSINNTTMILAILLNSRLFKFLNFFGQWFVFDREDQYYDYKINDRVVRIKYNIPYFNYYEYYIYYTNMNYKIPLLSRIRYEIRFKKEQKKNRNE